MNNHIEHEVFKTLAVYCIMKVPKVADRIPDVASGNSRKLQEVYRAASTERATSK